MTGLMQDLRYALRGLKRSPGFTLTAVISIAIAIGGNAAVFSVADALLLRDRPGIADPGSLVDVGRVDVDGDFDNLSYPDYVAYRERSLVFEGLAAHDDEVFGLGVEDDGIRVDGGRVSANYFDVLRVPIIEGRAFLAHEERTPGSDLAVISERLWSRRFNRKSDITGEIVRLNGHPFTIIGVAGNGFAGHKITSEELWVPIGAHSSNLTLLTSREGWLTSIGRLKPAISIDQARAQLAPIARQLAREQPATNRNMGVAVVPSHRIPVSEQQGVTMFVGILFGMVISIFFIACTNVGGMLLARAASRSREVAVRMSLGARRQRIVRLFLTEAALVGFGGAVVGSVGTVWIVQLLHRVMPVLPIPIALDFNVDWRVVTFSAALSVIAALMFGLLPALQMGQIDLRSAVQASATPARHRLRVRQLFVVAQVAMSVLLVVCAMLLVRSLRNADRINPGFLVDSVDMVGLDLRLGGYDAARGAALIQALISRVEQIPGVDAASSTWIVPLQLRGTAVHIWLSGQTSDDPTVTTDWNVVTPEFFDVLRIPVLRGRAFTASDGQGAPNVVLVNETLARRVWPNEDPIGRVLLYGEDRRTASVVGVVRDAKYRSLGENPRPFLYAPFAQQFQSEIWLLIRRDGPTVLPAVRAIARQLDPNLPVLQETTLADATAFSLFPHRLAASIAGSVGIIGILLASLGLYGITAYSVTQRTREVGVRIALGALPAQVLRLLLRQAIVLVSIGVAIGVLMGGLATQLLRGLLYAVEPLDAMSFVTGTLLLGTVAIMAAWFAARRAARVDPLVALRYE